MNKTEQILNDIENSIILKQKLKKQVGVLIDIADVLVRAFRKGNKVLLFGNGGSAADAQHIAAELMGKFYRDRPPLPVLALSTNTSSLTAIANDYGYDTVFTRQLQALVKRGDVVIGISTSGNSQNVIKALEEAKRLGAVSVAFIGQNKKSKSIADFVLSASSTDTPRIQETHITAGHIICKLVEDDLFGNE